MIAQLAGEAVADPDHPWTVSWPTAPEMATALGTTCAVIVKAETHLGEQGVLVKAWVPRPGGLREMWVPRQRALGATPHLTVEQLAAEIVRKGVSGEWAVLPGRKELTQHFRVSGTTVRQAVELLAECRQAVRMRIGGVHRWRIIRPHEIRSVDPRLTAPSPRVVVVDLIRRIRSGEFRYRLPDHSVHERTFLTQSELTSEYRISTRTATKVKNELVRLGWIVPGAGLRAPCRVAERVPPVDRTTHPRPRQPRQQKPRNRRARALADELITRVWSGEFADKPFPTQRELISAYHTYGATVRAVFAEMEQEGWLAFRPTGRGRVAVLADPLPDRPAVRPDSPVQHLDLTAQIRNGLLREGITTVAQLAACTDLEILNVWRLGVTSLRQIRAMLAGLDLDVGPRGGVAEQRPTEGPVPPTVAVGQLHHGASVDVMELYVHSTRMTLTVPPRCDQAATRPRTPI